MLSVIIPALNEEKALPATLNVLLQQVTDEQVIVVDGGSSDNTRQICQQYPQVKFMCSEKGRARQMNNGAELASGDTLLFLHADTLLPKDALNSIRQQMQNTHVKAGGFQHSFGDHDWRLRLISWLDNRRCMKTRVIYGDQAMFIRRGTFLALHGFPETDIMEDIAFCERLLQHTTPVLLDERVLTDPRKFIKMGVWHSLYRVIEIQLRNELGLPVASDHPFFREIR